MAIQPVYTIDPLDAFYLQLRNLGYAPGTIGQYRMTLTCAERALDGRGVHLASAAELRQLLTMTGWAAGLGPASKANAISRLITYREWAAEGGLAELGDVVPALRKLLKQIRPDRNRLQTYLEISEVAELEQAMWENNHTPARNTAILWVLAGAGGRITETLRLQLADVNLRDWTIWFRHDTKGGTARQVPMIPQARQQLQGWLHTRLSPSPLLFPSNRHGPLDTRSWGRLLHRTALKVERPDGQPPLQRPVCKTHGESACQVGSCPHAHWRVHPHILRHTFAVESLRSDALSVVELRDILGHASLATTNGYSHAKRDDAATTRFRRRFGRGGRP